MTCPRCQKEIFINEDELVGVATCPNCGHMVGAYPKPMYDDSKIND